MSILELISIKNKNFSINKPVTAVFLGDSVTHGCFETYVNHRGEFDSIYDYDAVYHTRLKKKLQGIFHAAPLNVINAGVSGGSAVQGNERLERDVLTFSPDLTVVCFGLNDVNGEEEGLKQYKASGGYISEAIKVWLRSHIYDTKYDEYLCKCLYKRKGSCRVCPDYCCASK